MGYVKLPTPIDITPATFNAFVVRDLAALASVPADAKAAHIEFFNNTGSDRVVGARNYLSTDDNSGYMRSLGMMDGVVGVTSQKCEIKVSDVTGSADATVRIKGYWTTGSFPTNSQVVSVVGTGWQDGDISSLTGAETALVGAFETLAGVNNAQVSIKSYTSTDDRSARSIMQRHGWHFSGVESGERCKIYRSTTNITVLLNGWWTDGVGFDANRPDYTPPTPLSQWNDMPSLPAGSTLGIFEVTTALTGGSIAYGVRTNGSARNVTQRPLPNLTYYGASPDASDLVEGYRQSSDLDFRLAVWFYDTGGGGGTTPVENDTSLAWHINQLIGANSTQVWGVLKSVAAQSTQLWDLLQLALSDSTSRWSTLQQVGQSNTAIWELLQQVSADSAQRWDLRELVAGDETILWSLSRIVGQTATLEWNLDSATGTVGNTLTAQWSLVQAIAAQLDVDWSLLQAVGVDQTTMWSVLEGLAQSIDARWNLRANVGQTVALSWEDIGVVGGVITMRWVVSAGGVSSPVLAIVIPAEARTIIIPEDGREIVIKADQPIH